MQKRVLIIDDLSVIREILGKLLTRMDFQILTAENGVAALEVLKKKNFDFILTDLNMPHMDGVKTVQEIRNNEGPNQNIPIFAVSAFTSKQNREKCFLAGINDILPKPLDTTKLVALLEKWELIELDR